MLIHRRVYPLSLELAEVEKSIDQIVDASQNTILVLIWLNSK